MRNKTEIMTNYYDWQSKIRNIVPDDMRIGDDLLILKNASYKDSINEPRKVDVTTFILMDKGESRHSGRKGISTASSMPRSCDAQPNLLSLRSI